jgi:antitoxin component YwqK of YwqJK toxin-antitoxin module
LTRYPNGKIKVKGQYKVPPKDILGKNMYDSGYCRQTGEWKYYKENGDLEKTEVYKDGELIK